MELAGLDLEIGRVEAADLAGDPRVLGSEILELERAIHRLMAQKSRRLTQFDRVEGCKDDGQTTTKAWLATQTLTSTGQAAGEQAVCRVRGRLPQLVAAWDAGQTTFDHVRTAEAVLRRLPELLWPEVDGAMTIKARAMPVKEFGDWLRHLAQSLGPEPKGKDETQGEMRRLSLTRGLFGMWNLHGRVTPEVAEKMSAALSAASRPDVDEVRTPQQRNADAFDTVLDTVLDAGRLPSEGGQRPHLTLTVDLDRISEQAQLDEEASRREGGDLWRLGEQERAQRVQAAAQAASAATDARSGRPQYYWTGPASVAATRRLACDGHLLPIFTREGQPVDVGRHTRIVSPSLRALIRQRDQHCRWFGCHRPGTWTQVHHVQHWRDGGPTDSWNLILLCQEHHTAAHNGEWTVVLHAPGHITVRRRLHPDDPLYEIRVKAPPNRGGTDINTKLLIAAEHARAAGEAA